MRNRDIVLDFGNHQMYLSGRFYTHKTSGNLVLVECIHSGKRWVYRYGGLSVSDREIRFYVEKEEEPPRMRLLPKTAHANKQ